MQIRFVYNLKALADDYINTPSLSTRPNYVQLQCLHIHVTDVDGLSHFCFVHCRIKYSRHCQKHHAIRILSLRSTRLLPLISRQLVGYSGGVYGPGFPKAFETFCWLRWRLRSGGSLKAMLKNRVRTMSDGRSLFVFGAQQVRTLCEVKYEIEDKEAGREESQNCQRHAEGRTERKKHGLTWHIPTMAGVVLDLPIEFER